MNTLRRFTDFRAWLRQLARASIHAGTSALIAAGGTNALEKMAPESLGHIGLTWQQILGVFAAAAFWEALRRINQATAETAAPFSPTNHQP